MQFDWDAGDIKHIARHGVLPAEAEQAMAGSLYVVERQYAGQELRFKPVGVTHGYRYLLLVVTLRGSSVRVVTAHTAKQKWRELHEQRFGERG